MCQSMGTREQTTISFGSSALWPPARGLPVPKADKNRVVCHLKNG
jgi:hypothetical protein